MPILFEVSHRDSLYKGLNKDRITSHFLESLWKTDLLVADKVLVENVQVILLNVKVDLIYKSLL